MFIWEVASTYTRGSKQIGKAAFISTGGSICRVGDLVDALRTHSLAGHFGP